MQVMIGHSNGIDLGMIVTKLSEKVMMIMLKEVQRRVTYTIGLS